MFYSKLTTLASLLLESASALETSPLMDYQRRIIAYIWLDILFFLLILLLVLMVLFWLWRILRRIDHAPLEVPALDAQL
jgi:hypothetical protein